jgi:hypothetical protein
MNLSETFQALRRANPRAQEGFAQLVEAAADAVRAQIVTAGQTRAPELRTRRSYPRRRLVGVSAAGATLAAAAAAVAFLTVASPRGGPGVENAVAAVKRAATLTAASAERSGTALIRITHNGEIWAGRTIRWHGEDLSLSGDVPRRDVPGRTGRRAGSGLLVVDGMMYGIDPGDGRWVVLGSPESIDPGSGTTPDEYLAAVREDVGGVTLRRIANGVSGLTTRRLDDGSTAYSGTVAAGLIARESGFKEGQPIRVFPFGYVAHDEAANPAAPLDVVVSVGADGIVRKILVTWGTSASAWTYTVTYSKLGTTAAPVAPANARPFPDRTP